MLVCHEFFFPPDLQGLGQSTIPSCHQVQDTKHVEVCLEIESVLKNQIHATTMRCSKNLVVLTKLNIAKGQEAWDQKAQYGLPILFHVTCKVSSIDQDALKLLYFYVCTVHVNND